LYWEDSIPFQTIFAYKGGLYAKYAHVEGPSMGPSNRPLFVFVDIAT